MRMSTSWRPTRKLAGRTTCAKAVGLVMKTMETEKKCKAKGEGCAVAGERRGQRRVWRRGGDCHRVDRVDRSWSLDSMNKNLKEQIVTADERHRELLNDKAEAGLREEGISEYEVWDPREERAVLDECMWKTLGWKTRVGQTVDWLRGKRGVDWEKWSESTTSKPMTLVARCGVRYRALRRFAGGREDCNDGLGVSEKCEAAPGTRTPHVFRAGEERLRSGGARWKRRRAEYARAGWERPR